MRTDLNINYLELEIIAENISKYMQTLMDIDDALMQLSRCLSEQTSEAVTALLEKIEEVRAVSNKRIVTLDMLSKMTNDYVAKLRGLVDCETEGTITRVDSLDIKHNLNQIGFNVSALDTFNGRPYVAYHVSYGDSPKELEKKKKHERNYRKVNTFRESKLVPLRWHMYEYLKSLYEIYEQKISKYEEADDEYRKKIDGIYYEMTSIPDLVTNHIEFGWSVYWSFSKSFCKTAAMIVAFVVAPAIASIVLMAYYTGCGCITYLPKEICDKGLMKKIYDHADKTMQGLADLCIVAMDNGPIGVVEYIGQGYADMAQTPEGVSSITGEVASLIVLKYAGKMLKTNVSPEKAEVKPVEGGSKTISQADRMKLDNGDYTLNDELYLKYRDVYDKPMYYDQATDKINWPVDDGLKAGNKIDKEIPKNTIFGRYGENSGEHLGKVTEPHETKTVPLSEKIEVKAVEGGSSTKPNQVHHFATNKSKKYTSQFESITKKYGLDLDGDWNKHSMPHQGRHPYAYHDYVLDNMQKFDRIANGDKTKFLKLYDQMKQKIINNPEMLYKDYWKK